ncbi:hypothetical protein GLOTRDRAFT_129447 [Gloeophyllum trabeum ATCC 11539]|uniref:Uncharacterized protein n=1 Tax=Gloeophyllum trabeum (strain ATCC 11539 / FP-39264 / Madison 617) TaxID=670483 RepID=S7RQI4_GLOTA|nr:uncharacterized protein GLOTRDRAFT_129447 [Gloeophyllum trabeum ATCC 11539]EPQ55154.1 hypothetical protein GLOTRDRAFT_129447 [Gloeophyllum trabeum ATCC 11539]
MSALVLPAKWARKSNAEDLRQIVCDHDSSADEEMEMEIGEGASETASDIFDTEIEYPSSDDDEHGEDMEIIHSGIQTEKEVLGEVNHYSDLASDEEEDAGMEESDVDDASSAYDGDIEDNDALSSAFEGNAANEMPRRESLRSRTPINEHEVAQPGVASMSIEKGTR